MIELRWVWCDIKKGGPDHGSICISSEGRLFQKLQYRTVENVHEIGLHEPIWSDWKDVPHSGVVV